MQKEEAGGSRPRSRSPHGHGSTQGGAPAELRTAAASGFEEVYGEKPTALGIAPGRIEVLGNHTDYNEGLVLSAAIDRYIVVAGRLRSDGVIRLSSQEFPGVVEVRGELVAKDKGDPNAWANYVLGVVVELRKLCAVGGFDAHVVSGIPTGAGVSSSAALEMATAKLLQRLFPDTAGELGDIAVIQACKAAENNFVGMGCGILDQFSSGKGRAGQLMRLDCRSLDTDFAPLVGVRFVLANTRAPHALVDGKYEELRRLCFAACDKIRESSQDTRISHLRDVDEAAFQRHGAGLSEAERKRASHIVYENARVSEGVAALRSGDLGALGAAMSRSHASSRHDFGNSCPELDQMVDAAQGLDGFLGGRLMGGGFGGCTINLAEESKAESFAAALTERYQTATSIEPSMLIVNTADGAHHAPVP